MSSNSHESVSSELILEQFLSDFEATNEYFRLTDGKIIDSGGTEAIKIANYHVPITDLINREKHKFHNLASVDMDGIWASLDVSEEFLYGSEIAGSNVRVGRGAHLNTGDRRIPVKLVKVDNVVSVDYWISSDYQVRYE